jgi:catechol 2,3-dioxygenase-like lactoylglutathione lyase family enzyme
MIRPALHHANLKTTRLQEMIDWYAVVLGAKVNFQWTGGAFMSNDRANHRIALFGGPGGCGMTRRNSCTRVFTIPPSNTTPSMT